APTVLDTDEYGNPLGGTATTRYGWLGSKQRSTETPSGLTLMGVRLYDPTTGRFLSTDPVPGGNANAYEYCNGDPLNRYDLDGKWNWRRAVRRAGRWIGSHQGAVSWSLGFGCSFITSGWGAPACAAAAGAITGAISYRYSTHRRKRHIGGYWAASWRGGWDGLKGYVGGRGKHYSSRWRGYSRVGSVFRRYSWRKAYRIYSRYNRIW
ncbi:RHS repeat-associated core domain-containing protein, partial [Streptomyces mirabilis]|uniref:RHS repeat-associated core domain-containing protein n=1 Tax=Streptomyces mirabilis TaxID=68239 RepID=UPI003687A8BF